MKFSIKSLPLLTGAIALSISLVSVLPAFSQSAQQPSASDQQPTEQNRKPRYRDSLNLTSAQRVQMRQIHEDARSQIDNILTEEQKAQLETARENRGRAARRFASLNLTEQQRSQIESVRSTTREQIDALLTPEQRQQMEQNRQQRQERRQARPLGLQR